MKHEQKAVYRRTTLRGVVVAERDWLVCGICFYRSEDQNEREYEAVPWPCDAVRLADATRALLALLDAQGVYVESESAGHRLDAAQDAVLAVLADIGTPHPEPRPTTRGGGR